MNDVSTGSVRPPSPFKYLRIPLLLAVGVMTMGSGLGNPGCGSSGVPDCEENCDIQGTYPLVFQDSSALQPGCAELGLTLPTELIIQREGNSGYITGQLLGQPLYGSLYESTNTSLQLSTETFAPDGTGYALIVSGRFSEEARTDTQPLTFSGEFQIFSRDTAEKCEVDRLFTSTRQ